MKGHCLAGVFALAVVLVLGAAGAEKPPAEYKASGAFAGGTVQQGMQLSGIRFGPHEDFIRMVLDLDDVDAAGARTPGKAHPAYTVSYLEYPYRLVLSFTGVKFDAQADVDTKPALPFTVVTAEDGTIKEMQVFLSGPCEFKVIEIDDPAKLSVDVRPLKRAAVPTVYTVQIGAPKSAGEAFALAEQTAWPEGCHPSVLVLGSVVVLEQAFTDASAAQALDAALRGLGYASVINERRGDELPQR